MVIGRKNRSPGTTKRTTSYDNLTVFPGNRFDLSPFNYLFSCFKCKDRTIALFRRDKIRYHIWIEMNDRLIPVEPFI